MAHGKLEFIMPAGSEDAFEAFFNHEVRLRWDTLLNVNYVESVGPDLHLFDQAAAEVARSNARSDRRLSFRLGNNPAVRCHGTLSGSTTSI